MSIDEYITDLRKRRNITITVDKDELRVKALENDLTEGIVGEIKARKAEILEFFRSIGKGHNVQELIRTHSRGTYKLSSAQQQLYFLHRYDSSSTGYNQVQVVKLSGHLDKERLAGAFKKLAARHESLRTCFDTENDEPVQKISGDTDIAIAHLHSTASQVASTIGSFIRPFDLGKAPLMRVGLISLSADQHVLVVDMHHIITDGASQGILIRDLLSFYQGNDIQEPPFQYRDYAEWQQTKEYQQALAGQREFWVSEFSATPPVLTLPYDLARPLRKTYEGASLLVRLSATEKRKLTAIAETEGATLFMVILAIYNILLGKLGNLEDIVIGTPVAGRHHADLKEVIGMFVNTLPLRNFPKHELTFREFLSDVRRRTLRCLENQAYPYEQLIDELKIERDISRNPLFDFMFVYQNFERPAFVLPGLTSEPYPYENNASKFDITLLASEDDDTLCLDFEYSTRLFQRSTIERFAGYFKKITEAVIDNIHTRIADIDLLPDLERHRLMYAFNRTDVPYPAEETIISLFEQQAGKTPENIALVCREERVSYRELNEKADAIRTLIHNRIPQGSGLKVGLMFDPSIDMIACMLGILKAACAYVPLPPDAPAERNNFVLADCDAKLLLIQESLYHKGPAGQLTIDAGKIVSIGRIQPGNKEGNGWERKASAGDLINIIYTSGSTGRPKGVEVNHAGIVNYTLWRIAEYRYTPDDVTLQLSPYNFDTYASNLYAALLSGSRMVIIPETYRLNARYISEVMKKEKVTNSCVTPGFYDLILNETENNRPFTHLRFMVLAGEKAGHNLLKKSAQKLPDVVLYNEYGPTEVSVAATFNKGLNCSNAAIIGKPIFNTKVFILDGNNRLLPTGVAGELCVAGVGVTRGYLNNSELTAKKFVAVPWLEGQRIYKTGDVARWTADGNIEFLGRTDAQVKIRGFRIEPGEIENHLTAHEKIKEAVVLCKTDGDEKFLVAYYVSGSEIQQSGLRDFLAGRVPHYMIPSYYVHLESLPYLANGKIDHKALPSPEIRMGNDHTPPANATQVKLVKIWAEVLKRDEKTISVTRSFFELGGHSLKATVLASKIFKVFNMEFPLHKVFVISTIEKMAEHIDNGLSRGKRSGAIPKAAHKEFYALSAAQKRLYFLYEIDRNSLAYNLPQAVLLHGTLDKNKLSEAFNRLASRHESLRTSFHIPDEEPVQKISGHAEIPVTYFRAAKDEAQSLIGHFIRSFDLSQAPLIRVGVIEMPGEEHLLIVDMHHIITDGASADILIHDFIALYNGQELPEPNIQYKDYAEWQQSDNYLKEVGTQREFWINEFSSAPAALDLPADFTRPLTRNMAGNSLTFELSREHTAKLVAIAQREGTTLYTVVLSIYSILLCKLGNREDVVIGTPTAGREHADLENVIGMFINTLPVWIHPLGELSFRQFLSQVKSKVLQCLGNQLFSYEALVQELKIERDTSRNPLFDAMFAYGDFGRSEMQIPGLTIKPYGYDHNTSKFDLTLSGYESGQQVFLKFEYSVELFKRETVERFAEYLMGIVSAIVKDADIRIADVEVMSDAEKLLVVNQFNNTTADFPSEETIVSLFEKQVAKTPQNTAVRFGLTTMTYLELNDKAGKIASYLKATNGIKSGDLVGVMLEREEYLIPAIFGILKAGGAYMPIDPRYPADRINVILEDAKVKTLITRARYLGNPALNIPQFVDLDQALSAINHWQAEVSGEPASSSSLAYVIYTSGSTGKPKGVAIEHRSVVNRILWMQKAFPIDHKDVLLQKTPTVFDVSVWELFWWSFTGASLCVLEPGGEKRPEDIIRAIRENKVTTMHFVPSMLSVFLSVLKESQFEDLVSLRTVFASGEALKPEHVRAFEKSIHRHCGTRLVNLYGPTEATVDVSYYECDFGRERTSVPIGKPIDNTQLYVLDKYKHLVPVGVAGELYIAGEGLAREYLHNEALTTEKFIDHPFDAGKKIYRTGDLAKWLPDGNIEFLGRLDDQVKIRGFRIELGEIEHQLSAHEQVQTSAVVVRQKGEDQFLSAYYVSEHEILFSELRNHLSARLPDYMVPSFFTRLDKLPLTSNGKMNRKALPDPVITASDHLVAPSNDTEAMLVTIFSDVLKIDQKKIGVTSSFFELGGHSLNAIVLLSRIQKKFNTTVTLMTFFRKPNVRELSNNILIARLSMQPVHTANKITI